MCWMFCWINTLLSSHRLRTATTLLCGGKTEVAAAIVSGHGSGHDTNVVPGESIVCGSVSCYMADITSMTKHSTTMVS